MKNVCSVVLFFCILINSVQAMPITQIPNSINESGSLRFANAYTTVNVHWAGIEELNISDYGLQANLLEESETQRKSDQKVWHAEPALEQAWGYDASANLSIEVGSWSVLPVNMDLLGVVEPNIEHYEMINPGSCEIESSNTLPQPTTVTLLGASCLFLFKSR